MSTNRRRDEEDATRSQAADPSATEEARPDASRIDVPGTNAASGDAAGEGADASGAGAEGADAGGAGPAQRRRGRGGVGQAGMGGAAMPTEKLLRTREVIDGIFSRLGIEVETEVHDTAETVDCKVRIKAGAEVLQSGQRRQQLIDAVQHLVDRIVNRDAEGRKRITLDVGERGAAAASSGMDETAASLAKAVQRMGRSLTIVPMHPMDRKAIHLALAEVEGIQTRSEGDGNLRRIVIEAK